MRLRLPLLPGEIGRTALLAFLLFTNTLVLESSEVIATSGFVSQVGVDQILLIWATVMVIAMLTSSAYALFVDRVQRARLAVWLFFGTSLLYLGIYVLFTANVSGLLSYGLLAILTEQQWTLLPLVIGALTNDMFPIAATKRIFPLLATVVIIGGVAGNGLAAALGEWLGPRSYALLLVNGVLLLLGAATLWVTLRDMKTEHQQSEPDDRLRDRLKKGLEFVQNVPAYRTLAIMMLLMGFCLNTIQYQFLVDIANTYTDPGHLQTFYGSFKIASVPLLLIVQNGVTPWLLKQLGFKTIFAWLPGCMLLGLVLTLFWISPVGSILITGAIVGNFLVRVVLSSIDQPARQAFQGLVPDQRRGRVSALMEGFLYQLGSVLSCGVVGGLVLGAQHGWLSAATGRTIAIGICILCALIALLLVRQFYRHYDASMLNWRLKRRQHGRSVLDHLKFLGSGVWGQGSGVRS